VQTVQAVRAWTINTQGKSSQAVLPAPGFMKIMLILASVQARKHVRNKNLQLLSKYKFL